MTARTLQRLIPAIQTSDGAGVTIKRSLGQTPQTRLDPFLMLDFFGSDQPGDYIKGFPPHPHRGFETVTYMLDGHMLHQDHLGNQGHLKSGGVQWMTAGRGIIHSEMPQQEQGLMQGFQLWLNLPAAEKMQPAAYVDIRPELIPHVTLAEGNSAKVIAGLLQTDSIQQGGPIRGLTTDPQYYDLQLRAGSRVTLELPVTHNAFVYPYSADIYVQDDKEQRKVPQHQAGVLTHGNSVTLVATEDTKVLLLAAAPIGEPVVQYGPFVMNSTAEIEQAISDYQQGKLTANTAAGSIKLAP
ncbi:pirin family protein [Rheinheimera sp.]|uniref:pirin family protein n=1 Tax=Rheinheimera sp. TaxID=1869214 RepID=UPI00273620DE|nr:pirin family protein [Rheinheimera sp.]MDP2716173.1 pirin family protein [Rheinheimera sp.]